MVLQSDYVDAEVPLEVSSEFLSDVSPYHGHNHHYGHDHFNNVHESDRQDDVHGPDHQDPLRHDQSHGPTIHDDFYDSPLQGSYQDLDPKDNPSVSPFHNYGKPECSGTGGASLSSKADIHGHQQVISRTHDLEQRDHPVSEEDEVPVILPLRDGGSPSSPIFEFGLPSLQVHARDGAPPPPPPPGGPGGTDTIFEGDDGGSDHDHSRSRTLDYGPRASEYGRLPPGGRRTSSRARGTSIDRFSSNRSGTVLAALAVGQALALG